MTRLRATEIHPDALSFREDPPTIFGAQVTNEMMPGSRSAGVMRSLGQGVSITGFGYARDQWWTVADALQDWDSEPLTLEKYEELRNDPFTGPLEIPYDPTLTVRQFRNQVRRFRREQYLQTYERSVAGHATHFVGAMAGGLPAPEILATLPIGGPLTAAAIRAPTTGLMMRQALLAGGQVSAAATPLNIFAQQRVYGQVDPLEVAFTAIAPLAFSPVGVAFARAFTKPEIIAATAAAETERPRGVREPVDEQVPNAILEQFNAFDGGAENWLARYAARDQDAISFLDTLNLDANTRARLDDVLWRESAASPIGEVSLRDFEAISAYAMGRISREQVSWLTGRGLFDEAQALRVAQETPPPVRTTLDRLSLRQAEARRAELIERFPELQDALRWQDFLMAGGPNARPSAALRQAAQQLVRAIETRDVNAASPEFRNTARRLIEAEGVDPDLRRIAYRQETQDMDILRRAARGEEGGQRGFIERMIAELPESAKGDFEALRTGGLEALRYRYANRLSDQVDDAAARLGALLEQQQKRKGRPPKEVAEQKRRLQEQIKRLSDEIDRLRGQPKREPESVSVDELAEILDASVGTRPITEDTKVVESPTGEQPPTRPLSENERADAEAAVNQYLRENGIDPDDLADTPTGRALRIIEECQ